MAESANLKLQSVRELRQVSEKDKELARQAWQEVEKNYELFGVHLFRELFTLYPSYKRFFLDVLGGDDDPFQNKRFQKHMLQVLMPTLRGVVDHLDSPEAVHEAMKRLGVLHRKKEFGLRRENVDALNQVLLATLKLKISGYTEQQDLAMTRILTIVFNMFSNGLEGKTG